MGDQRSRRCIDVFSLTPALDGLKREKVPIGHVLVYSSVLPRYLWTRLAPFYLNSTSPTTDPGDARPRGVAGRRRFVLHAGRVHSAGERHRTHDGAGAGAAGRLRLPGRREEDAEEIPTKQRTKLGLTFHFRG